MTKHTAYGAEGVESRLVHEYNADLLGAPFKVVLIDSVKEEYCSSTGDKINTLIPDLQGLLRTIAAQRAIMPRRLNGSEIKFLRNAISFKAKQMAAKLEMSVEHYSRVENDAKPLGSNAEKLLRAFIITQLFQDKDVASRVLARVTELLDLKIEGAWSPDDELVVRLVHARKERDQDNIDEDATGCANDNGEWFEPSNNSNRRFG